ncbi:Stress responsive alpha-beta barrel domain-containing protein [Thalassoporum mexicanum PCC 7367]|uniref:Dabb family protein n=1 Tax=Thalassoporum mexicanum TaxID=3457544 RepID=UPI00029FCD85|nr:Dabb family protein [Pseudanabaena sp. PCC 7367]AFY71628.1 Stress responsive alpha-beta barrel domain-containing protein [Pseudanabaena sp. PCC 7367]
MPKNAIGIGMACALGLMLPGLRGQATNVTNIANNYVPLGLANNQQIADAHQTKPATELKTEPKAELSVHHIVLIELKPTATEADIEQITTDAYALLGQIPGVVNVEVGLKARDNLPIHIGDYDMALYLRMSQESDIDVFGPHPQHIEFRNRSAPKWQKIEVLDFFGL